MKKDKMGGIGTVCGRWILTEFWWKTGMRILGRPATECGILLKRKS
jgi:hypothetical protein